MKQFWTVLKFELGNYLKNKGFLVATLLIAVICMAAIVIPALVMEHSDSGSGGTQEQKLAAVADEKQVIADREAFGEHVPGYQLEFLDSEEAVRDAVLNGDAQEGLIVTGADQYSYVVRNTSLYTSDPFEEAMAWNYRTGFMTANGLDADEIEAVYNHPMDVHDVVLGKDSAMNYWYTYVLIFLLYFLVIFYGQMIATSVTLEKSNRAIEILVTSVNGNSLIFGKVLAGAIGGVIQAGVILGSALAAYHFCAEGWKHQLDFLFQIPPAVWAAFVVFGLMGYLLYAFVYGMVGALVSRTEDISKSVSSILILYMLSFFLALYGMNMPDALLVKAASFVPFTSSNAMLIRIAMGTVAPWEVGVSAVLLGGSCILVGILAAKIFRFGTLLYGNPIKLSAAIKEIRKK